MNPLYELDALVGESIMGLKVDRNRPLTSENSPRFQSEGSHSDVIDQGMGYYQTAVPRYSTDIASAWTVVRQVCTEEVLCFTIHTLGIAWQAIFHDSDLWKKGRKWEATVTSGAPEAICRAALRVYEPL